MATGRVYRAGMAVPGGKGRVYRAGMTGAGPAGRHGRIYSAGMTGAAAVVLSPVVVPGTVEPMTELIISMSLASGDAADTWTWRQVSGPLITFYGSGSTRSFTTPSTWDGGTVVIGVRATLGGVSSAERQIPIEVLPQIVWVRTHANPVWRGGSLALNPSSPYWYGDSDPPFARAGIYWLNPVTGVVSGWSE